MTETELWNLDHLRCYIFFEEMSFHLFSSRYSWEFLLHSRILLIEFAYDWSCREAKLYNRGHVHSWGHVQAGVMWVTRGLRTLTLFPLQKLWSSEFSLCHYRFLSCLFFHQSCCAASSFKNKMWWTTFYFSYSFKNSRCRTLSNLSDRWMKSYFFDTKKTLYQ